MDGRKMHQLSLADFCARTVDLEPAPDEYAALADEVRAVVSQKEYAWLSAAEKQRLQQDLTEPEPE